MTSHYTITIPTKPYLAKYIQSLYGQNTTDGSRKIIFNKNNPFCMVLYGFITKNENRDRSIAEIQYRTHQVLNYQLPVYLPKHWIHQYYHDGSTLKAENAMAVTMLFETFFEEDMYRYCGWRTKNGAQRITAIEEFANYHGIIIEEDITRVNLVKTEYRFRIKKYKNNKKSPLELSFSANAN